MYYVYNRLFILNSIARSIISLIFNLYLVISYWLLIQKKKSSTRPVFIKQKQMTKLYFKKNLLLDKGKVFQLL